MDQSNLGEAGGGSAFTYGGTSSTAVTGNAVQAREAGVSAPGVPFFGGGLDEMDAPPDDSAADTRPPLDDQQQAEATADLYGAYMDDLAGDGGHDSDASSVQMLSTGSAATTDHVQRTAAAGVQGGGSALPHFEAIQASFGPHDVSGVRAHVGGSAGTAAAAIGAEAYATGNDVAFAQSPDLHTAAHEAAHVVQQRAGVQLLGGVGEAGDVYEQNADAVADAVVRGESATGLLGGGGGGRGESSGTGVQLKASGSDVDIGSIVAASSDRVRAAEIQGGVSAKGRRRPAPYVLNAHEKLPASVTFLEKRSDEISASQEKPIPLSRLSATQWPEQAPMSPSAMIEAPDPKRRRLPQSLVGPEVAAFNQWIDLQNALATAITASVHPAMGRIEAAGFLTKDFRPKDPAKIQAILRATGKSGVLSSYAAADRSHAGQMAGASSGVAAAEAGAADHSLVGELYRSEAVALRHSVSAARSAINAFYLGPKLAAAQNRKAGLESERGGVLRKLDALVGFVGNGLTAYGKFKAGFSALAEDKPKTKSAHAKLWEGGGAAVKTSGIFVTLLKMTGPSSEIRAVSHEIRKLRGKIAGQNEANLNAKLAALEVRLASYVKVSGRLARVAELHNGVRQTAMSRFGLASGEALVKMKPDVLGGASLQGATGDYIHRLFLRQADYALVRDTIGSKTWPELQAQIPLGGYLFEGRIEGASQLARHMVREAAKLRWWKPRTELIKSTPAEIMAAIKRAGGISS